MAWRIELVDDARKDLASLDKPVARRITAFLRERIAPLDDPRAMGEALKGSRLGQLWNMPIRLTQETPTGSVTVVSPSASAFGDALSGELG